ncbi:hypothetical protein ACFV3R_22565 [Streptomyces sp. NPDC059740]|uniref:hypothetical protein n=1 Tax=Streptomyces sp. NPDC059740 TaxID=3346926 RepID=UPI003650B1B0
MAGSEFSASGVRIERSLRSLTRAGKVVIRDGVLALLNSRGTVIDSAPVGAVETRRPWFDFGRERAQAVVNGHRYSLTWAGPEAPERFVDAVEAARTTAR